MKPKYTPVNERKAAIEAKLAEPRKAHDARTRKTTPEQKKAAHDRAMKKYTKKMDASLKAHTPKDPLAIARQKTMENLKVSLSRKMASIGRLFDILPKGFEEGVFFLLRASDMNDDAKTLVETWQLRDMPMNNNAVFDDLCMELKLNPMTIIEAVCEAAHKYTSLLSFVLADVAMPSVVKTSIRQARKPQGIDDRKFLATATKFLPTSKGININNMNANQLNGQGDEDDNMLTLPSFDAETVSSCDEMRKD